MKHETQLDTPAGRYAISARARDDDTIDIIEVLQEEYGLAPKDAEQLVDLAEEEILRGGKAPRE